MPAARSKPLQHTPRLPTAVEVTEEVPGALGVLLWRTVRSVYLWAGTPPRQRAKLFADTAADERGRLLEGDRPPRDLRAPLVALAGVLTDSVPSRRVAEGCASVAEWGLSEGCPLTAFHFAQGAALAEPRAAKFSFRLGQIARDQGMGGIAEEWLRYAAFVARKMEDWEHVALSHIAQGNLHHLAGRVMEARKSHHLGRRYARRHGLREIEGRSLHDLIALATTDHDWSSLDAYAERALRCYGTTHPRLAGLAHDTALAWLLQGQAFRALAVFRAVLSRAPSPALRLVTLGNIARAAGACGMRDEFARQRDAVWQLKDNADCVNESAPAVLAVARGAHALGLGEEASQMAEWALARALERGEMATASQATALLATASSHPPADVGSELDALSELFVQRLEAACSSGHGSA